MAALLLVPATAFLQVVADMPVEALSGGSFSNDDAGSTAYLHPTATLDAKQTELFALGHKMFHNRWAFFWFENAEFGRGPTSNAQSCTTCHANNGRGVAPVTAHAAITGVDGAARDHHITVPYEPAPNLVIRLSLKGNGPHGGPLPHPDYGDQLQIFGVKGVVPAEGQFSIEWREQVASAFLNDIGLSSPVYPDQNCPPVQKVCKEQMVAGKPEITALRLDATQLYIRALTVPARRQTDDARVKRGEQLFAQAHCSVCHVPELKTGESASLPQLARQTIRPYTDLLLHDMGDGLADGRPDFLAGASEWRTPPLWGIGLSETVNGASAFLHDGRARNFTEAILWHRGEAEVSREAFRNFTREDRAALITFLGSL